MVASDFGHIRVCFSKIVVLWYTAALEAFKTWNAAEIFAKKRLSLTDTSYGFLLHQELLKETLLRP